MPRKQRIVPEKEFQRVPHVSFDRAVEMLEPFDELEAIWLLRTQRVLEKAARTYRGFTPEGTMAKGSQSIVWLEEEVVRDVQNTFCSQKPGDKERL